MKNGKLLVAGGFNEDRDALKSVELFDPSTETWTVTGNMHHIRGLHTASVLSNGKVLVSGGTRTNHYSDGIKSAELYDPFTGKWTNTSSMNYVRWSHTATLLLNGSVLVVGNSVDYSSADSAELYNSTAGTHSRTNLMYSTQTSPKDLYQQTND